MTKLSLPKLARLTVYHKNLKIQTAETMAVVIQKISTMCFYHRVIHPKDED